MITIKRNDWTDLGRAAEVVSDLAGTAPDKKAERLANAAWQALSNLNAYIVNTPMEESIGEHIWNADLDDYWE